MAQLKNINNSVHQLNTAATNAYAVIRSHTITNLGKIYGASSPSAMRYKLGTLYVKLDTLAGLSATPTLTVRLTRDAAGNDTVVGDVTASISLGVTTSSEGAVTVAIDFVYSHNSIGGALPDNNLFLFWKLDQGTAQVRRIELTTEE